MAANSAKARREVETSGGEGKVRTSAEWGQAGGWKAGLHAAAARRRGSGPAAARRRAEVIWGHKVWRRKAGCRERRGGPIMAPIQRAWELGSCFPRLITQALSCALWLHVTVTIPPFRTNSDDQSAYHHPKRPLRQADPGAVKCLTAATCRSAYLRAYDRRLRPSVDNNSTS